MGFRHAIARFKRNRLEIDEVRLDAGDNRERMEVD